ncbi:MAG: chemotaxis protein CheB [Thermoanaerobaculaceae bacterium]
MNIKVLLVDDSPTVRAVLRRVFAPHPELTVVGEAANGREAIDLLLKFRPDVILMDVEMPVMDGFEAIEQTMRLHPTPILVLTSRTQYNHLATAFEAIRRGALDVLPKPEAPEAWAELTERLPKLVRTVASRGRPTALYKPSEKPPRTQPRSIDLILVGASTGGPGALRSFLAHLPPALPAPVAVVQHITPGFEDGLARWLADATGRDVQVLKNPEIPPPRVVRLAPAMAHMVVDSSGTLTLDKITPPSRGHRPSVDVLFQSALAFRPSKTAAILLSGMGDDGAQGLLALRNAGALTAVQDEASSAIFGMPRQALKLGAAEVALSPEALARFIADAWKGVE